jgi:hypothetical protein
VNYFAKWRGPPEQQGKFARRFPAFVIILRYFYEGIEIEPHEPGVEVPMNDTRFADDTFSPVAHVPAGFLFLSVASNGNNQASGLQQFYQQLYEQAVQATRPARLPDLFTNMN